MEQLDGLIGQNENAQKARATLLASGLPVYHFKVAVEADDQVTVKADDQETEQAQEQVAVDVDV